MKSEFINKTIDVIFDFLSSIIGNFASNLVPLLAGILPAYMTWTHITGTLGFPSWVGFSGAGVMEFLGLGAGNEMIKVWNHNRQYKDEKNHMPFLAPLTTALWYVLIMISFNVILEAFPNSTFWKIVSIALFATLAIPAYALVAGKTLRMEWKHERTLARAERTNNEPKPERTSKRTANERLRTRSVDVRSQIETFVTNIQTNEQRTPGPSEIAAALSVSKGYASDTLKVILNEQKNKNPLSF